MKKIAVVLLPMFAVLALAFSVTDCGDDEDGCDPPCPDGGICVDGSCVVKNCCSETTGGKIYMSVAGNAIVAGTNMEPAIVYLAAISPLDALSSPNPTHIATGESDSDGNTGAFELGCFDVTDVVMGMVILTDDLVPDGSSGDYFPTGTGVKLWETKYEKQCVEGAVVIAVPNMMVMGMDAALIDFDLRADGFVMGMVVDASGVPVAGVEIKKADGTDLDAVFYPEVTGSFGIATDVGGAFLLPASNFAAGGIVAINAYKSGMTFGPTQVAAKSGFCFFAYIIQAG